MSLPLLTAAEARAMDAHAENELEIPTLLLMENAGRGAADAILALAPSTLRHVVLLGGIGQNGGDAWVVARHLHLAGVRVSCILVDDAGRKPSGDAATNLAILEKMGISVRRERGVPDDASLIVDAIYGTGLKRAVDGVAAEIIARVSQLQVPVVSLDLPSGIDADSGAIRGVAMRADLTLTFGHAKRGLYQGAGGIHSGEIRVLSIGAPLPHPPKAGLLDERDLAIAYSARATDSHKGTAGHVLVVAGAAGTSGAALLSARGASRGGAGLVTLAIRPEARASLESRLLEWMSASYESPSGLLELLAKKRALVIGPGLGLRENNRALVEMIALEAKVPVVLDADALTLLKVRGVDQLRASKGPRVLTPHPAEAARLLDTTTELVQCDRHAAARALAEASGATVVLKGRGTIVATEGEPDLVCARGSAAMGTGGSGDVLAGIIAAVAQLENLHRRVGAAVLAHALAGELAAIVDRGLLASELADNVPAVLRQAGRFLGYGSAKLT